MRSENCLTGVEKASERMLGLIKRRSSTPKCTLNNLFTYDSRPNKNVVADGDLEEGDVGKMLAKEKDLLYASRVE